MCLTMVGPLDEENFFEWEALIWWACKEITNFYSNIVIG